MSKLGGLPAAIFVSFYRLRPSTYSPGGQGLGSEVKLASCEHAVLSTSLPLTSAADEAQRRAMGGRLAGLRWRCTV